jgi:hypothetical protein
MAVLFYRSYIGGCCALDWVLDFRYPGFGYANTVSYAIQQSFYTNRISIWNRIVSLRTSIHPWIDPLTRGRFMELTKGHTPKSGAS